MSKQKQYIGSGKAAQFNSVTVTLNLDEATKHSYSTQNGTYITFMVSPKKDADRYGKTHSAFVLVDATTPEPDAATNVMAEPELPLAGETPVGATVKKGGRSLKRISKEEAAARKAAKK
jgi:hypothetical protein